MLKKINWKKGYGEVIGYTIAVLFLIGFFSQIVGIYMYARCGHTLNDAVMNIGRSLVTEESINDAQAKAKKHEIDISFAIQFHRTRRIVPVHVRVKYNLQKCFWRY